MRESERREARPDPTRGIFETMRIREGVVVDLEAHLDRLEASLSTLGWPGVRAAFAAAIRASAATTPEAGRVRLEVRPDGSWSLDAERVDITGLEALRANGIVLRPVIVPGGLGDMKWVDRSLLDGIVTADDEEALLVDEDGSVLETGRGNLLCDTGEALVTPPLDGRILPGVTRRAIIEATGAREQRLTLDDLVCARGVLACGSVRGALWARATEGLARYGRPERYDEIVAILARIGEPSPRT